MESGKGNETMKYKIYALIFMILFSFLGITSAAEITLQWDANEEADLAGYYIYYKPDTCCEPYDGVGADGGDAPIRRELAEFSDPQYPEYTLTGLEDNRAFYFVVTAFNADELESGFSNEVKTQAPQVISPPVVTYISNDSAIVEWSTDVAGDSEVRYDENPNTWEAYAFVTKTENTILSDKPEPDDDRVQGQSSALFEAVNNEYMFLNDADATSDMPWKSGTAAKTGTVWMKFKTSQVGDFQELFSKYDFSNNRRSILIYRNIYTGNIEVSLGYNDGTSFKSHVHDGDLESDQWYAIAVSFEQNSGNNADPEKIYIEVRTVPDGSIVGSNYTANAFDDPDNHELSLKSAPYVIGAVLRGDEVFKPYDGLMDEVIISNAKLIGTDFENYAKDIHSSVDSRYKCVLNFEVGDDFSNDATGNNNFNAIGDTSLVNSHSVLLTGLMGSTDYFFRVGSTDVYGFGPGLEPNDANPSAEFSFRTESDTNPDQIAPKIIEQPSAVSITDTTAVIEWKTDESANGFVEYGLTDSYGMVSSIANVYTIDHSIILSGLVRFTDYHFRVTSEDRSGNTVVSDNFTFKTNDFIDTEAPIFTSAPTVTVITHNSFTVEWMTNEHSDSRIQYGTTSGGWGSYTLRFTYPGLVTAHSFTLTGLKEETEYYCRVGSVDPAGNGPIVSSELKIKTTIGPDENAPQIVGTPTVIALTDESATIVWVTDEPAISQVEFGSTPGGTWGDYDNSKSSADLVTRHFITLTNLNPGTTYYFRVGSTDSFGNGPLASTIDNNPSNEIQFTTKSAGDNEAPQIITPPTITNKSSNSLTVEWETDEPSNSIVRYGWFSGSWNDYPLVVSNPEGVTQHRVVLSDLWAGTNYFLRVGGVDSLNNGPNLDSEDNNPSAEITVLTEPDIDEEPPQIISPPTVTAKTNTVAVIEWDTDEPSNSMIQYGTTSSEWDNYEFIENDDGMVTHHIITLTDLSGGVTYYFRVGSMDEHGNGPEESPEIFFKTETEADTSSPRITIPPTVTGITDSTATIEWETDEPSNSEVKYLENPEQSGEPNLIWEDIGLAVVSSNAMVTRHSVTLTNLNSLSRYYFIAGSTDAAGNGPDAADEQSNNPFSQDFFYTEALKDEDAPRIISGPIVTAIDNRSAIIEWETDEPSNSIIKYGEVETVQEQIGGDTWENLPLNESDAAMVTQHSVTVTDLNPLTTYAFRTGSMDAFGNGPDLNQDPTNASVLGTFETEFGPDEVAPIITNLTVFFITNTTALITWDTDEPSNSIVQYGEGNGIWNTYPSFEGDVGMLKDHSVTITGLEPNTTYFFRVGSTDARGNGPWQNSGQTNPSHEMTFTTEDEPDTEGPQISNISVDSKTDKIAVIKWTTNEPGNSQVRYDTQSGLWQDYKYGENDAEMVTEHSVTITGLNPSTLYYFRVGSTDATGNKYSSDPINKNPSIEKSLTTQQEDPPSIVVYPDTDYPKVDSVNNFIEITYDESNMRNARLESNYIFIPDLTFSDPGDSIAEISAANGRNAYRLSFTALPAYTVFTLLVGDEITDADGYGVDPTTVLINDNDADGLPDDWELDYGLDPENGDTETGQGSQGDFDGDGFNNYDEFMNNTDPLDENSSPSPPELLNSVPHDRAGIDDNYRVSNNSSFGVLISDTAGINTTVSNSIVLEVNDNFNPKYEVDAGDTSAVRLLKMDDSEPDTMVTAFWFVYDRSLDTYGNFPFDADVEIQVTVTNVNAYVETGGYQFRIETETEHNNRPIHPMLPDFSPLDASDPDLADDTYTYNAGYQINSGIMQGTKIIFNDSEPIPPEFAPTEGIPDFLDVGLVNGIGGMVNIQPSTIFNIPVKLIIPNQGENTSRIQIYVYNGVWTLASDIDDTADLSGWLVPGSRLNNDDNIEIKVYHFSGVHAAVISPGSVAGGSDGDDDVLPDDVGTCLVSSLPDFGFGGFLRVLSWIGVLVILVLITTLYPQ